MSSRGASATGDLLDHSRGMFFTRNGGVSRSNSDAEFAGALRGRNAEERRNQPLGTPAPRRAFERGTTSGGAMRPDVVPQIFTARRDGACSKGVLQFLRPSALRARRACEFCVAVGRARTTMRSRETGYENPTEDPSLTLGMTGLRRPHAAASSFSARTNTSSSCGVVNSCGVTRTPCTFAPSIATVNTL
jgi:hypothetical protein